MTTIAIQPDVRLRREGAVWSIERRDKAEAWKPLGHHGSLSGVATSLLDRHVHLLVPEAVGSIRELAAALRDATERVAIAIERRDAPPAPNEPAAALNYEVLDEDAG